MSRRKCGWCGKKGIEPVARIDGTWYCHDDDSDPTCYMLATWNLVKARAGSGAEGNPT